MSPNASYRTTARCRSASRALAAQRGDLLAQPVHVLGQRVDAGAAAAAVRRSATSASSQGEQGDDEREHGQDLHAPEPRSRRGSCAQGAPERALGQHDRARRAWDHDRRDPTHRLPGRTRRQLPPGVHAALPRLGGAGVRVVRGRLRGGRGAATPTWR